MRPISHTGFTPPRKILLLAIAFLLTGSMISHRTFTQLLVLEGTWKMETRRSPLFESWQRFDKSTLQGLSYRITGSDTILLERLKLVRQSGEIFYIPAVINQNDGQPVSFKLISSDDNRFVFENKQHDFPQRIIYSIVTKDSIVARIEGISKGREASSDFYYRRIHAE